MPLNPVVFSAASLYSFSASRWSVFTVLKQRLLTMNCLHGSESTLVEQDLSLLNRGIPFSIGGSLAYVLKSFYGMSKDSTPVVILEEVRNSQRHKSTRNQNSDCIDNSIVKTYIQIQVAPMPACSKQTVESMSSAQASMNFLVKLLKLFRRREGLCRSITVHFSIVCYFSSEKERVCWSRKPCCYYSLTWQNVILFLTWKEAVFWEKRTLEPSLY